MTDMESRVALALEVTNLRELLTDLLGSPGRNGRWKCPFHEDENPDLSVKGQKFVCFACNEHGNAFDILRKLNGWAFMESLKWMESRAGLKPALIGPAVKEQLERRATERERAEFIRREHNRKIGALGTHLSEIRKSIRSAQKAMPSQIAANLLATAHDALQKAEREYDRLFETIH